MVNKICLFTPYFGIGGVTEVTKKISLGISDYTKEKVFILTLKKPDLKTIRQLGDNVEVVSLNNLSEFLSVSFKSKIIFLPSYHSIPFSLFLFCFLRVECYFIIDRKISSYRSGKLYSKMYFNLFRLLIKISKGFVFTYHIAEADFNKLFKSCRVKTTVINYPVSKPFFEFREPKEIKIDVLYAGRLESEKGVIYLLQAIHLIKKDACIDLRVSIIGSGSLKSELIEYCQNNDLNNVNFLDYTDNIHLYMQQAKIFVLPSINEGCASVIKECIVSRLPSVVTNVSTGGPQEAIGFGLYGEVSEPASPSDLKDKILLALDKQYDDLFRDEILNTLNLEFAAKRYLSFIKEI